MLTKALRVHTQDICNADIGIQVYRQLSIAIIEKHVKQISRPFHLNDDRSAQADMEVAFAWQSGHKPNQRGTSYGIDGAFPDSLQPALLGVYRWTSDQWHRFIDLKDPMRRRRRAREAALQEISRQWQQAGLSIRLERDPSQGIGPILVVNRSTSRS